MSTPKTGLRVASVLFGLMSMGQLWRVFAQPDVLVNGASMPVWPSVVAFLALAGLCVWMWRLAGKC